MTLWALNDLLQLTVKVENRGLAHLDPLEQDCTEQRQEAEGACHTISGDLAVLIACV